MDTKDGNIYLIANSGSNEYAIGYTYKQTSESRIRDLQTGNSNKLMEVGFVHVDNVAKVVKMVKRYFFSKKIEGMWYDLDSDDVHNFRQICLEKEKLVRLLMNNPFFNENYGKDINF